MRSISIVLLLIFCLLGCQTSDVRNSTGQDSALTYPVLTVNSQPLGSAIINREPPRYGLDTEAGCIVLGEFHLEITRLEMTNADTLTLAGTVTDVRTEKALPGVSFSTDGNRRERSDAHADGNGAFELAVEIEEVAILEVEMPGYRSLKIDLEEVARALEN